MFKYIIHLINMWNKKNDVPEEQLHNTVECEVDDRDFIAMAQEVVTPKKYLINKLPPIRHQSIIGSCASHASMAAYETLLLNNSPRAYIEGSELFHYYNARVDAGSFPNDTGMTLRMACSTIYKYGMALEYACPYDTNKFNTKPSSVAYAFAKLYKAKEYYRVMGAEAIKEQISQNIPIICGIWVHSNFYGLDRSNFLYKPNGVNRGGHAVNIVGYDDERQVFILRNSWGIGFGDRGYFEMSYESFEKYGFDTFIINI